MDGVSGRRTCTLRMRRATPALAPGELRLPPAGRPGAFRNVQRITAPGPVNVL